MSWKSTKAGYGWPAIALHWLVLGIIAGSYATMELKSIFPKGTSGREAMATWHYTLGLCVFFLVWLRLAIRVAGAEPVTDPPLPAWQARSASVVHWALYALMIGLPLLGWLTLSAKGTPVPSFGIQLPALTGENKELAKRFKEIHEAVATAGYFVIGLHAAAALYHHYVRRDNTLKLMLRGR